VGLVGVVVVLNMVGVVQVVFMSVFLFLRLRLVVLVLR
jgi:hypothetical protein